ncbi:hypothetical protein RhiirA4_501039 [Rhizophagus irregularis]|uniref:Uncharacterized protein n=1 Tax=Rhizophagus irregularis TaxID=588596 RepID=A0A2I1H5W8_9GLOM|nr:hypothetical protein RhiirA4_501039 [Rhizophagus irregularis]
MSTLSEDIIDLEEFDEPLEYDSFSVDTEEINQDDEESEVAVFISDSLIKDVRHTLVPIEYPATSDEGIAYVYHVKNWTDPKDAFHDEKSCISKKNKTIIDDEKDDNLTEINAIEIEERKVSLEERKLKLKQYEIDLNIQRTTNKKRWKWR